MCGKCFSFIVNVDKCIYFVILNVLGYIVGYNNFAYFLLNMKVTCKPFLVSIFRRAFSEMSWESQKHTRTHSTLQDPGIINFSH